MRSETADAEFPDLATVTVVNRWHNVVQVTLHKTTFTLQRSQRTSQFLVANRNGNESIGLYGADGGKPAGGSPPGSGCGDFRYKDMFPQADGAYVIAIVDDRSTSCVDGPAPAFEVTPA